MHSLPNNGYPDQHEWNKKPVMTAPKPVTIQTLFPGFDRWAIGFNPILDTLKDIAAETKQSSYPPYNIRENGDETILELAVAGFSKDDITITVQELSLLVEGKIQKAPGEYTYKGIAGREFSQRFALAEYVIVKGAEMRDGMLLITLKQELPEEKKPITISIN